MNASDINVGTKGGGRIMKIKDLIKKLQELDIYDTQKYNLKNKAKHLIVLDFT